MKFSTNSDNLLLVNNSIVFRKKVLFPKLYKRLLYNITQITPKQLSVITV